MQNAYAPAQSDLVSRSIIDRQEVEKRIKRKASQCPQIRERERERIRRGERDRKTSEGAKQSKQENCPATL